MSDDNSRFLQPVPPAPQEGPLSVSLSAGMAAWLLRHRVSLAFTSYQTGRLVVAGVAPDGRLSFTEQNYARAMGLQYRDGTLYVASLFQIWRLRNMLGSGEFANQAYDCILVPRTAHTTGYVDAHELAVESSGRIIFVNSLYSCLATTDDTFSFRPLWKPEFISALAGEDRCHLNGLAMEADTPRFVTALGSTDTPGGWRVGKAEGGVLIDILGGRTVRGHLSMPHSPRVTAGGVVLLDSGRGNIVRIEPQSGKTKILAFCPGYLRGMALINGYAVVGVSKPRHADFGDLPIQAELKRLGTEPWCAILVVELASGRVVEFIRYESQIDEIFDIALLPEIRNPTSVGPATEEVLTTIRFNPDSGLLRA